MAGRKKLLAVRLVFARRRVAYSPTQAWRLRLRPALMPDARYLREDFRGFVEPLRCRGSAARTDLVMRFWLSRLRSVAVSSAPIGNFSIISVITVTWYDFSCRDILS